MGVKCKPYNPGTDLDLMDIWFYCPGSGGQGAKLNLVLHEDAVHAAHSSFRCHGERPHCRLVHVDVDTLPFRTILFEGFDPFGKCETGRPIWFQSGRREVKFVLDPRGTTDEVVETTVYLFV